MDENGQPNGICRTINHFGRVYEGSFGPDARFNSWIRRVKADDG